MGGERARARAKVQEKTEREREWERESIDLRRQALLVRGASFHANKQEASCSDPAIEQSTEELKTIGREKEGFSALSGGTTVVFLALGG